MSTIARIAGVAMLLAASFAPMGSNAQSSLPAGRSLEALLKSSLISFNDANVTGNYEVFHAKLAKPFRQKFSPRELRAVFKEFTDKAIDLDIIAAFTPVYDQPPVIDGEGRLSLKGYFATEPSRVQFDMDFIPSEGDWRLLRIHVQVVPAPGLASQ
jgi:hypothetical protein